MAADEFDAPLGKGKISHRLKLPFSAPQILSGLLGTTIVGVGLWTLFATDPYGGEPVAVVPTKAIPASEQKDRAVAAAIQSGAPRPTDSGEPVPTAVAPQQSAPPGSKTVTIIDGSSGKRQEVVLPAQTINPGQPQQQPAATEQKFNETIRHGTIPKIAADGTRPSVAFSHPITIADGKKNLPRIAIIIGNLGISASGTAEALERLPGPVTLAFTPYGPDIERLAERAAAKKHEILLQVPMEPFDYPDNDPGPQTLLTTLSTEQNIDRLHWQMSRLKKYVGVIGFMGARFANSEQALSPIIRETAKRGLIYIDNAASQRSVASQIAGGQNLPFARADVAIDAVPTSVEIDRALSRLEGIARERGTAIGMASALPAGVARISDWVKKAESRGIILVPISMVALKAKQS